MPRWKALPEELDPQIREFASQLRRLVDRSGLSVAALADRTGYSRTSWERYLNGRLLAPKGAVVALAEVTGTNPVHLTTMWELAERAWSRAEMRHDRTMEAIRISQARAALGDFGGDAPGAEANGGKPPRKSGSATAGPGAAGPADVSPRVPAQPTASDADAREGTPKKDAPASGSGADARTDSGTGAQTSTGGNSWNVAGYRGPSRTGGRAPGAGTAVPSVPSRAQGAGPAPGAPVPYPPGTPGPYGGLPGPYGGPPQAPAPAAPGGGAGGGRRQQLTMFLAGLVGVLVVIGAVFHFTGGNDGKADAGKSPSPSASTPLDLPPGVKCSGDGCTGKDAERMGCSGELVTTARSVTVGTTFLEIRYSKTCGAAWARITQAVPGDEVQVTVGSHKETGGITKAGETIAYTPMVAVKDAARVTACATLASGQQGCTK